MIPSHLHNRYFQVGSLLSCNRALLDARSGILDLEQQISEERLLLWKWKVQWVGICSLLRASVHLMSQDSKACHDKTVCEGLRKEWAAIKAEPHKHQIYWQFINSERNSILKEYHWTAYEAFFDEAGEEVRSASLSVLSLYLGAKKLKLRINGGVYRGRNAIEVLQEASDWVEQRIKSAVAYADFALDDYVHYLSWTRQPAQISPSTTILGAKDRGAND